MSTASCQSTITYLDGDKGELMYRGYPIEQLAEKCNFLEVCYLSSYGELPNADKSKFLKRASPAIIAFGKIYGAFSTALITMRIRWR